MQRCVREKYIAEKLRARRCVDYRTGVYLLTELCFTLEYDKCARSGLRKLFASRTDSLYTVMYVGGRRIRLTFKIKSQLFHLCGSSHFFKHTAKLRLEYNKNSDNSDIEEGFYYNLHRLQLKLVYDKEKYSQQNYTFDKLLRPCFLDDFNAFIYEIGKKENIKIINNSHCCKNTLYILPDIL